MNILNFFTEYSLKKIPTILNKNINKNQFQSGEMCIRSPTVMKGYFKNQKATKECITEDGFFRTGDLGHYDIKYGLYVTDRIKELIKVSSNFTIGQYFCNK